MVYSIEKITTLLGARRYGEKDSNIAFLLTDSRSLSFPEETLFFALQSERNDGHNYIDDLHRRGVKNFCVSSSYPIPTDEEWKEVQESISKIVNSKKTKIEDKDIQYLPINMLTNLKIVSKKTFRLLAGIIENDFGININEELNNNLVADSNLNKPIDDLSEQVVEPIIPNNEEAIDVQTENDNVNIEMPVEIENQSALPPVETPIAIEESNNEISNEIVSTDEEVHEQVDQDEEDNSDIIIDYRTRFFEEQEKNKHLNDEIEKLKEKLNNIDKIIKGD